MAPGEAPEQTEPVNNTADDDASKSIDWVALISVVLLSLMAITTAWTGFQASKWGGAMSIAFTQAGAARLESAAASAEADRLASRQTATFAQWLVAQTQGDKQTMEAIESRFRDPLKSAFDAWIKSDPFTNPDAPETPFDLPQYTTPALAEAQAAEVKADALFAEGLEFNQRGDNYTILTVIGAAVLFFAALSTRFTSRRNQWVILGVGIVMFVGVAITLVIYPKLF